MQKTKLTSEKIAPFLVLLAAITFSIGGVLVKLVSWSPLSINAARSLIAAIEIFIYMKLRHHKLVINKSVLIDGTAMAACSILWTIANKLTSAANAILLEYTAPIFIIFLMWAIFREKPDKTDIVATIVMIFGVVLFFVDSISLDNLIGNVFGLGAGVTYALVFMMKKFKGSDTLSSVLIGCILSSLIGLPWLIQETDYSGMNILGLLLIGILQFGFSYICMAEGLVNTPPLMASLISMVEPILNPILAAIILKEILGTLSLIGAAIVIGGVAVYNIVKEKNSKASLSKAGAESSIK